MSNAGVETQVEMFVDNVTGKLSNVRITYACVVLTLRRRKPVIGESERSAVLIEEILLLEAEPGVGVIKNCRPRIARVRSAIRPEHL